MATGLPGILRHLKTGEEVYNIVAVDNKIGEVVDSVTALRGEVGEMETDLSDLVAQVDNLESLGQLIRGGIFDAPSDLPTTTTGMAPKPTAGDFAFVKDNGSGKAAVYIITTMSGAAITWGELKTFESDVSGKMDIVTEAAVGAIAEFDGEGGVRDSGVTISALRAEIQTIAEEAGDSWEFTTL